MKETQEQINLHLKERNKAIQEETKIQRAKEGKIGR